MAKFVSLSPTGAAGVHFINPDQVRQIWFDTATTTILIFGSGEKIKIDGSVETVRKQLTAAD